jgi:hypothetical protein
MLSKIQFQLGVVSQAWEVEIRRISVRPDGAKSSKNSISINKRGVVVCAYHPSYMRSINRRIIAQTSLVIKQNLI